LHQITFLKKTNTNILVIKYSIKILNTKYSTKLPLYFWYHNFSWNCKNKRVEKWEWFEIYVYLVHHRLQMDGLHCGKWQTKNEWKCVTILCFICTSALSALYLSFNLFLKLYMIVWCSGFLFFPNSLQPQPEQRKIYIPQKHKPKRKTLVLHFFNVEEELSLQAWRIHNITTILSSNPFLKTKDKPFKRVDCNSSNFTGNRKHLTGGLII